MPSLPQVLDALYSGGDVTIFQATVDAVGSGVVTLHANGGQFTDVPYLDQYMPGAAWPSIDDRVYVVGRKGWGMLVIGRAAPSDREAPSDGVTQEFGTASIGQRNFGPGTWTVPSTDVMQLAPGSGATNKGAFYFHPEMVGALPGATVATASFWLGTGVFNTGGAGVDNAYIEVGLFSSSTSTPSASPVLIPGMSGTYKRWANSSQTGYVSIPLEWASRLLAGTAQGIYVLSEDYPGTAIGPGTVRLTTL